MPDCKSLGNLCEMSKLVVLLPKELQRDEKLCIESCKIIQIYYTLGLTCVIMAIIPTGNNNIVLGKLFAAVVAGLTHEGGPEAEMNFWAHNNKTPHLFRMYNI